MKDWNMVVTSQTGQEHRLLRELADLGEFHPSGFREVLIGRVADAGEFLAILKQRWQDQPFFPEILSTATPVARVLPFTVDNLSLRLKEEALAFLAALAHRAFYVRVKRRGHKGEIKSQEVEQELDRFLLDALAARQTPGRIDFQDPDAILLVELLHNQCGLTLITRDMREQYPFIKVK
jgi:tRNA(Ser,Leu) C12 N-acetylase TAN1